ncbi:hypothetical protein [Crenalkalicoccus roseus]|uniref:hypothetical protein n=1 Tax=Crenalkalicoccus roseus TaxID=1485588 RepID=UPI001081BF97|nr:hypothetical protein [Crenalkalicoccus roseus]
MAWANTYQIGIDYTATATRCGNAVLNRHRAPASRHLRLLGAAPNPRAAAFRRSATEVGVEGLTAVAVATSTTSATTLAALSFNGLDRIAATTHGLLLEAQRGLAFVVEPPRRRSSRSPTGWPAAPMAGGCSCAASTRRWPCGRTSPEMCWPR